MEKDNEDKTEIKEETFKDKQNDESNEEDVD